MKRFNNFYKRIIAYAFDFLLIQLFVSILVDSSVINFQYKDYSKVYKEYESEYNTYYVYKEIEVKDCDDLKKQIDGKKIKEEEIVNAYKDLDEDNQCDSILELINSKKISEEEYKDRISKLYYKLQRLSTFKYVIMIIITYLYLVLFQGYTNGKTLGKKIMHIRVISQTKKNDVTYKQLAIRTILLGNNIFYLLMAILPWTLNQSIYVPVANGVYSINNIFVITMIIIAYVNKEMLGLHDRLAKTKVIIDEKEKK